MIYLANKCDKRSLAHKRHVQAQYNTADVVLDLLRQTEDIPARYVLFDGWFTMSKIVAEIKLISRKVIGMERSTEKVQYQFNGKWFYKKIFTARQISVKSP